MSKNSASHGANWTSISSTYRATSRSSSANAGSTNSTVVPLLSSESTSASTTDRFTASRQKANYSPHSRHSKTPLTLLYSQIPPSSYSWIISPASRRNCRIHLCQPSSQTTRKTRTIRVLLRGNTFLRASKTSIAIVLAFILFGSIWTYRTITISMPRWRRRWFIFSNARRGVMFGPRLRDRLVRVRGVLLDRGRWLRFLRRLRVEELSSVFFCYVLHCLTFYSQFLSHVNASFYFYLYLFGLTVHHFNVRYHEFRMILHFLRII